MSPRRDGCDGGWRPVGEDSEIGGLGFSFQRPGGLSLDGARAAALEFDEAPKLTEFSEVLLAPQR